MAMDRAHVRLITEEEKLQVQIKPVNASAMFKVLRMGQVRVFYLFMFLCITGRLKIMETKSK